MLTLETQQTMLREMEHIEKSLDSIHLDIQDIKASMTRVEESTRRWIERLAVAQHDIRKR